MDYEGFQTLIAAIGDGDKNTAQEMRNLLSHLLESVFLPGDIKLVHCTQLELTTDYTSTGIGIGKRSGWARCNGLNGTPSYGGRVPVGHGDTYSEIGGRIGSASTTFSFPISDYSGSESTDGGTAGKLIISSGQNEQGEFLDSLRKASDAPSQSISVMQPGVITLYLMKLHPEA